MSVEASEMLMSGNWKRRRNEEAEEERGEGKVIEEILRDEWWDLERDEGMDGR